MRRADGARRVADGYRATGGASAGADSLEELLGERAERRGGEPSRV
jgi:hypothetical protein